MAKNRVRYSKDDMIFTVVKYAVLSLALLVVLYPLYFIVIASVSDPTAVNTGKVLFKVVGFSMEGYRRIMADDLIWTGYKNTIIYTTLGTSINLVLTFLLAYPLSRKEFKAGKYIMIFLLITMYFNGGLIPRYLVVKELGLINKWYVMILINAVNVFNVIIARTFLKSSIPDSLYEAAVLDGCTHFQFLGRVVIPLSKPIIAVLVLYYGIQHWNEFFAGLIYLRDEEIYPLQLVLRSILIENNMTDAAMDALDESEMQDVGELIKYGVIIVSSLPVLILYPFLQKYFVQGVMIGSVKG